MKIKSFASLGNFVTLKKNIKILLEINMFIQINFLEETQNLNFSKIT